MKEITTNFLLSCLFFFPLLGHLHALRLWWLVRPSVSFLFYTQQIHLFFLSFTYTITNFRPIARFDSLLLLIGTSWPPSPARLHPGRLVLRGSRGRALMPRSHFH